MRSQNEPIQLYPSLPHLHQFHHLRESEDYNKSGQALFTALKLRLEGLVPSSGARCAPANSTYGSSTARLFPTRRALRSETCGRSAPGFAHIRKKGHGQQSVAPLAALAPQPPARRAGQSPTAPRGHHRPGAAVSVRAAASAFPVLSAGARWKEVQS